MCEPESTLAYTGLCWVFMETSSLLAGMSASYVLTMVLDIAFILLSDTEILSYCLLVETNEPSLVTLKQPNS